MITYTRMPEVREWDGQSYDRISGPMQAMGRAVLARLELAGDETVLDAGCGSGAITEALIERLPRGRVIAVDASASMVAGRARAARARERTCARPTCSSSSSRSPSTRSSRPRPSTGSPTTSGCSRRLRAALRPGGRLVAQCGGEGNITKLRGRAAAVLAREPYAEHFRDWRAPWNYAGAGDTASACSRPASPAPSAGSRRRPREPEHPREFLSTIVLGPHVQQLPEELREPFMDEVLAELGEPVVVDYVRLNIDAIA